MALILNVKNSQSEFTNTGFLFQGTWYVDNSFVATPTFTGGLESASFCGIKSGTSLCLVDGLQEQATLFPASDIAVSGAIGGLDVTALKASGIIYKESPRDRYGRTDNLSDETRLHPYGNREDKAIGLLKKGVLEVSDFAIQRYKHFASTDTVLVNGANGNPITGTVTSNTLTLTAEPQYLLKYGDKVQVGGTVGYVTNVVSTTVVDVTHADISASTVTNLCQIDDPIYLNTFTDTSDIEITPGRVGRGWNDASELPFRTFPLSGATIDQVVGYIESPIAVRIDLTIDNALA